jgi:hypothetical protein
VAYNFQKKKINAESFIEHTNNKKIFCKAHANIQSINMCSQYEADRSVVKRSREDEEDYAYRQKRRERQRTPEESGR